MAARTRKAVEHDGRVTRLAPPLSRRTLELCDWLLDQVTLSAQAADFEEQARAIAKARREVDAALRAAGGTPISVQRAAQG